MRDLSSAHAEVSSARKELRFIRIPESGHLVQFYETERGLIESLCGFVGEGLVAGEPAIVIATAEHLRELNKMLEAHGLDLAALSAAGKYVCLDAADTLSKFLVNGLPDPQVFQEIVDPLVSRMNADRRGLRVFGEMVALLWADGNREAALKLEELWNDSRQRQDFTLLGAYPMAIVADGAADLLEHICGVHSAVIPGESYSALGNEEERRNAVFVLQRKARMLEAEAELRKQVEEQLRVKESQLKRTREVELFQSAIIESADDAIISKTPQGIITSWNPAAERIFGYKAEEVIGKSITILIPGERGDEEKQILARIHRGEHIDHYETRRIRKDGRIIDVSITVSPVRNEDNEIIGASKIARDITERKQAEIRRDELLEQEQRARSAAENANRMKDEFLATVSHELRTPLNAIIGWCHMLKTRTTDPTITARAIDTIDRNAKAQAQLVEDILDVSRVITGKLQLSIARVDLSAAIYAAIDSVQLAAESKGIRMEVISDPHVRYIRGDAARLQQVVWNLLSNAVKFTSEGGEIVVRLQRSGSDAEITVTDSGEGITPEFLPFIFERFSQADSSTTRRQGGLGLGLAIVRHLTELHGGTVVAESAGKGRGATFTIRLPLRGASEPMRPPFTQLRVGGNYFDPRAVQSLEGVRVLIVDDNRDTLSMLSAHLTDHKAEVETATSVAEALEILRTYQPQVLVSDVAMPVEDGYSLISRIRQSETGGDTLPAIALTALARVEDRARALSAGFNMFVPKPFEPAELVAAIAHLTHIDSVP